MLAHTESKGSGLRRHPAHSIPSSWGLKLQFSRNQVTVPSWKDAQFSKSLAVAVLSMLGCAGCALAEFILYDIQGLKRKLGCWRDGSAVKSCAALVEDPEGGSL